MSDPKQIYERHVAAFNDRDAEAFPWSAELEFAVPGAQLQGPDEVLGFISAFWAAFPDARNEARRVIADGALVAAEGTLTGTHTGTLRTPQAELPPTGRSVRLPWSVMCEMRGDEMISEHLYFDQVELLTQLGLAPTEARATA